MLGGKFKFKMFVDSGLFLGLRLSGCASLRPDGSPKLYFLAVRAMWPPSDRLSPRIFFAASNFYY